MGECVLMWNIIIGLLCVLLAIILIAVKDHDTYLIVFNFVVGIINIGLGCFGLLYFNNNYIITINQKDGTSIEVKTESYDIEDTYIKIKQDDSYIYIYDVKDVKITEKDK